MHRSRSAVLWICASLYLAGHAVFAGEIDWVEAKKFWSFQPPQKHIRPAVQHQKWPRQTIDYFILRKMEQAKLQPAPESEPRTLIRRLSFDLQGLPPPPEEVDEFLADRRPDAYERWVDRYLDSLRFGEHLAGLWLGLVRYAEDQAFQVGQKTANFYPNAYRYRNWVIQAFNRDMPYDEFIKLQLASDKFRPDQTDDLPALGFLGLGPKYYNRKRLDVQADEWEDRVDTVSRTFLGLTVACARCHEHKFDPITMADYYGMAGVFASTEMWNMPFDKKTEELNEEEKKKLQRYAMHIVKDGEPKDLPIFKRGNVEQKGPIAPRGFLRILKDVAPDHFSQGSGRKELAEAIANPKNPLTARVMVNRIWDRLFGQALVGSPSNFGQLGSRPTHPELLDDLSVRFMQNNWSIKQLVRELVLSSTYRQRSTGPSEKDPDNRLYTRMNRRRLTVEQWRDSILAVSGKLDLLRGRSLELDDPKNNRRTVNSRISRLSLNNFLMQFDYPDANVHNPKRSVTISPLQKLFAMNSPFILGQTEALTERILAEDLDSDEARIKKMYELLFARRPQPEEIQLGQAFLTKEKTEKARRWRLYAHGLLASNEMFYLD